MRAELRDAEDRVSNDFTIGSKIGILFRIEKTWKYRGDKFMLSVEIRTDDGLRICNMVDADSGFEGVQGFNALEICVSLDDIRFYPGSYTISLYMGDPNSHEVVDHVEECLTMRILTGLTTRSLPRTSGLIFLTPRWQTIS